MPFLLPDFYPPDQSKSRKNKECIVEYSITILLFSDCEKDDSNRIEAILS
jgi:hypothetical protein